MATFKKIAYLVNDKLKLTSDDSHFNIKHIYELMNHFRSLLLHQRYIEAKKSIPEANYQLLCIDLEYTHDCLFGEDVKSVDTIPNLVNVNDFNNMSITPQVDHFGSLHFVYTNRDRLKYVGNNRRLKNFLYFTIGPDKKLYVKSGGVDFKYLSRVGISGVFENPDEAALLECDNKDDSDCDIYEKEYPLEATLIPVLIEMVYNHLVGDLYRPKDEVNDNKDELSNVTTSK